MKTTTQIELNLTISDISAIYSKDYDSMIIQQAKAIYEGRCMDNQFIQSIDNVIVKRSLPNLIRRDLDAKIRIYAIVSATVIRYDMYDTINRMIINKIIPKGKIGSFDLLECSNDHAKALIKLDEALSDFKVGDTIPVKVGMSQIGNTKVGAIMFKINHTEVMVSACPFIPHRMDSIAYVVPKISPSEQEQTKDTLTKLVQHYLDNKKNSDTTRWKYFDNLVYPYKTNQTKKAVGRTVDLLSLLSNLDKHEGDIIMINQMINLSALQVSIITKKEAEDNNILVVSDTSGLYKTVITFVKHLDLLSELSDIYKDELMFDKHQYVWNLYEQNKF